MEAPKYIQRLLFEYGGRLPGKIQKVSCVPEQAYNDLQGMRKPKGMDI